ncbi:reverse transcriptase domain-containing protein [Thiothrix subterranea]|uniref:Reverse transcriptase domain-containing protein n=1 Tax=Thiothrix subterranea TaxID=2735563 RepID=A0AA51MIN1_9GAMM|nr:reverse transcriptase domain-containing protein [Thiothrix subterranea]WML84918.1 reverse transcriptase domain-containing protein [Thiothrix subterranea]
METCAAEQGSAGIDGITLDAYPDWAKAHWANIRRGLLAGYYCPQPVRRVEFQTERRCPFAGYSTVNDRLIQQAIVQRLQPLVDPSFSEHSYGFRPHRSAHHAIRAVQGFIRRGDRYAVDIDLSKFFDNVDHDLLMHRLGKRVNDPHVLTLIGKYLRAGVSHHGNIEATHGVSPKVVHCRHCWQTSCSTTLTGFWNVKATGSPVTPTTS